MHRFRLGDVFRYIFDRVVATCMTLGLVKGEGFAVDASVMEANARVITARHLTRLSGPTPNVRRAR